MAILLAGNAVAEVAERAKLFADPEVERLVGVKVYFIMVDSSPNLPPSSSRTAPASLGDGLLGMGSSIGSRSIFKIGSSAFKVLGCFTNL